ncbi:hypothetical protein D3C86_1882390 [compost metagenome]
MDALVLGRHSRKAVGPGMNSLRFRATGAGKVHGDLPVLRGNQFLCAVVNPLKHVLRHVPQGGFNDGYSRPR